MVEGADIAVAGMHIPQADSLVPFYSCEYIGTAMDIEKKTLTLADKGTRLKKAHAEKSLPNIIRINKRLKVLDGELEKAATSEARQPLLEERKGLTVQLEEIKQSEEIFDKTDPGLQQVKQEITNHNTYLQALMGTLVYSDPNGAAYVRNLVAEWDKSNPMAAASFVGVDYGAGSTSLLSKLI
ncbi:MAG: hypothetical protein A3F80_03260 [Candidatus Melainabacteria bacterium RIFCSPLOWO2_12_FULL_35_11]|nr:MAG: hypothetical protein A3F80_03260 [Candidatus Melainabacteria bacterium RIFCSPLOWO2_12_FULL_35_11]